MKNSKNDKSDYLGKNYFHKLASLWHELDNLAHWLMRTSAPDSGAERAQHRWQGGVIAAIADTLNPQTNDDLKQAKERDRIFKYEGVPHFPLAIAG